MREYNVGILPVCLKGRVLGIVTDRDIVVRCIAEGYDSLRGRVEDAMTQEVFQVPPDVSLHDAASIMESNQVRRLVVIDRGGRLIGLISVGDLAFRGESERLAGEVLDKVGTPGGKDEEAA